MGCPHPLPYTPYAHEGGSAHICQSNLVANLALEYMVNIYVFLISM
jgi:hypothetical protein